MTIRARRCPDGATAALFVEGGDDEAMIRPHLQGRPVFIQVLGGSTPELVRDRVRATIKDPGWPRIRRVGVLVDAGEDATEAFEFSRTVFREINLPIPTADQCVESRDGWTVGSFVVPGGQSRGGSDTLFLRTVGASDLACVDAFIACTGRELGTKEQRDKARAWALSAALGPSRTYRDWREVDPHHPALTELRRFLHAMVPR